MLNMTNTNIKLLYKLKIAHKTSNFMGTVFYV